MRKDKLLDKYGKDGDKKAMPHGTGRTSKVNFSVNPDLYAKYKAKCREMGMAPSANFELWMKAMLDSEGMMQTFDNVFSTVVKAEIARLRKEKG